MAINIPEDLYYLPSHQWARINGDIAEVGITDFAQKALGGITWIELPESGQKIGSDESLASVESAKTVSDVLSPVSGEIVEINAELEDKPELCNEDPYGAGWIAKIKIDKKSPALLDAAAYAELRQE